MEEPKEVSCPWCGEAFTTFVDVSLPKQEYTEDCQVCCRPIILKIAVTDGQFVDVEAERE